MRIYKNHFGKDYSINHNVRSATKHYSYNYKKKQQLDIKKSLWQVAGVTKQTSGRLMMHAGYTQSWL